jgi:hypothetical protein
MSALAVSQSASIPIRCDQGAHQPSTAARCKADVPGQPPLTAGTKYIYMVVLQPVHPSTTLQSPVWVCMMW